VKRRLLEFLVCPSCQSPFDCETEPEVEGEIVTGRLACPACHTAYPITNGIPRILPASLIEEQQQTADSFGWQWLCFPRLHGDDRNTEQFLGWIAPLTADSLQGQLVLDAGCGMGRFAAVASRLGAAEVVAIDLSQAVEAAQDNTKALPNVHVVQADIYHLPFRRDGGDFGFIYSIGVLHHLPDPEAGFHSLVKHLRSGGTIFAWVYGYENNEWIVRYVNPVRRTITSRLPPPVLYLLSLCVAVPLHLVLKAVYAPAESRRALAFLRPHLPYKYLFWLARFGFRHTHLVVFDHLNPPKAVYLRHAEFAAWFERAGLAPVTTAWRNENSWQGYGSKPAVACSRPTVVGAEAR
jgi:SAM-dependent methyltransferase